MANTSNSQSALVSRRRGERELRRFIAPVACAMALFVAAVLMVPALSMTRGELVCDLDEHTHSGACYEQVLACGMEEGEGADAETGEGGHEHEKGCYEKQLTCDTPEHKHSDGCYAPEPEPEPEFVADSAQDAETVNAEGSADGEDAGQEPDTSDDTDSWAYDNENELASPDEGYIADAGAMPAQSFTADLKYEDGTVAMTVSVEAPAGAFPAGTFMKIDGVAPDTIRGKLAEAIDGNKKLSAKLGGRAADECMAWRSAVDVRFTDPDGNLVDAARKATVRITAPEVRDLEKPVLVRTVENKSTRKIESAEVVRKVKRVNADERDASTGNEDTLKFKAAEFTTFAIVGLDAGLADGANADDGSLADESAEQEVADGAEASVGSRRSGIRTQHSPGRFRQPHRSGGDVGLGRARCGSGKRASRV